ncbi:rho GTPase-activating protein 30 [Carassius gibelio]|uniref:rho GTPase-activating protein 30 n=1 Tax=Carassius gibelio TaxID=101364 RepID=UPI0022789DC8|nr:rho GTPase-activating protein 30 [Carassius gibelio]XP_052404778.1 rho GTPase-activating protein 30 [Carassius gibelio]XP_052404779.1 rho GTPase-activating protein 30 [Carassius gibelio]
MRRGRRKGGSRDKVFGCDLLEHLNSTGQDIPQVLRSCSEFIEKHGIVDGIYRLSGVSSNTQKLRSEFDSEGSPDLYKDLYLQDIHCVSSLCKAYFRELPNPLLTYELYDRFADAVAIQLEDERLVKIKEVLKDLPALHHRTLEFLMRHLVKMSTFASLTNMHARNLAIVWAPNLLRSKDIESTGFNGTAAFMEVRVQSIVVEFILTHVADLFPGSGMSVERRKSLPSPSILSSSDDPFFKSLPLHCPGNLSPGDGPPAMRPYHAIIDGTDKRKGSLKGRKWKSIFNLGGRLQDPRKKNKYCPKDKEKTGLRPAKSMDSLSSDSRPLSPLVVSTASGSSEGVASAGGGVSSGYAVTYRRTGGAQVSMVSRGTPGTYNRLQSGGGDEGVSQGMARSPGMTSRADRRAGIHISGPFSVTVPLHITSGLALGVLHGGWNDKEQPLQGDKAEDEDVKSIETESTDGNPQSKNDIVQESESETIVSNSYVESQEDCGKDMAEITRKEINVPENGNSPCDKEAENENLSQNQESMKENIKDPQPQNQEATSEEDYMEMRGNLHREPISAHYYEDMEFPETDLPLDFQEAFGFLDSMESGTSNPVEFSVEAPFENEYEEEEDKNKDNQAVFCPSQNSANDCQTSSAKSSSPSFTHRPLSGKSHSLPFKSRPFLPALSLSSDDEYSPADDDESDKDSEYEDMFCQSLPACQDYQGLSWLSLKATDGSSTTNNVDLHTINQSNTLPPENNNDAQSIDQSEDAIPAASALTDSSELNEEHLSLDALKTDEVCMDEKKNEESHSKDVENDKHALIGEDDPESEPSEEDTYFGPDSTPPSPEPNQTETDSITVPEPIPALSPAEDAQQVLDADGCHGNSGVPIIDELTDADQTPEEHTQIINETMTVQVQTVEDEKSEETMKVTRNMEQNEGEEFNKTDTGEGKCDDVEEDAKAGSVEEFSDGDKEQKQVNRKEDLGENSGDCEENPKDGPKEEAKRQDSEKNCVECEEDEEQDKNKAERQEYLAENNGEFEENVTDGPKEGNEAERREDLELNSGDCVENAEDGSIEEAKQDLEIISGECEEIHEEQTKDGEQEAKNLEENSEESENVDEEYEKEGEQDKNEAERREDLEENSGDCEENAKAGSIEEAKQDLEIISGECEEIDEEHIKDSEENSEGNSEEDENVKTESSVEGDLSPDGGDDLEKSTFEQRPDEIQHEPTENKEEMSDQILAAPRKRSPRKPANAKAVPVVPPKPQTSKITAFTFRKQLQHRQHDEKEAQTHQELTAETITTHRDEDESAETGTNLDSESPGQRRGTWDGGADRRRDADREAKRNSGISMCFDQAVARATEKRSRERGSTERLSGTQWDRESRKDGKTD